MTGAGAVHPAVLLVRVLRHALAAVVEGALDAAHAAERVHHRRGRAQARVVAQPPRGERSCSAARRAPAPPAHHADDGLRGGRARGGRGGELLRTGRCLWVCRMVQRRGGEWGRGDHRCGVWGREGVGRGAGPSLHRAAQRLARAGPQLAPGGRGRPLEGRVHVEVLCPGAVGPRAGQRDGGGGGLQSLEVFIKIPLRNSGGLLDVLNYYPIICIC